MTCDNVGPTGPLHGGDFSICRGWDSTAQNCCINFCNDHKFSTLTFELRLECGGAQPTITLPPDACMSWTASTCGNTLVTIVINDITLGTSCVSTYQLNCQ